MDCQRLIEDYLAGSEQLRQAVAGLSDELLDQRPVAGLWSTRQVVCHLSDFEPIYADRIKRVIAQSQPQFPGGDPDQFAAALAYEQRSVQNELEIVEMTRRQLARILRQLDEKDFQRVGIHLEAGPLTLAQLLVGITEHIPHHIRFIEAKRRALGV